MTRITVLSMDEALASAKVRARNQKPRLARTPDGKFAAELRFANDPILKAAGKARG